MGHLIPNFVNIYIFDFSYGNVKNEDDFFNLYLLTDVSNIIYIRYNEIHINNKGSSRVVVLSYLFLRRMFMLNFLNIIYFKFT